MSDWDELSPETLAALEVERNEIEKHIRRYIEIMRADDYPEDAPFVQEWICGVEWTNIEMERDNAGGRDVIARSGSTLSAGLGLGVYIRDRYGS